MSRGRITIIHGLRFWENHSGITRMSVLPLSRKGFFAKRKVDS